MGKWNKSKKNKMISTVATVLVIVLLIGGLTFDALSSRGVFLRAKTVMSSDDYTVNGAMMTYYMNANYHSYMTNMENTYSSLLTSLGYDIYDFLGIDPSVSLKKQVQNTETGATWFDYFADTTKANVEQYLVYCQAAKEAGITLDEDDLAQVEQSLAMMQIYASYYGYTYSGYITSLYGTGVREKDVRDAMELSLLASKYAQQIYDGYYDNATAEEIDAYYAENTTHFLSADYLAYKLTATKAEIAADATEEEKAKIEQDYATLKESINAAAEKLVAFTDAEEFKEYVRSYWATTNKDIYEDKYYEEFLKEAEGDTDEEKAAAAQKLVEEKLAEDAQVIVDDMLVEDYAYAQESDFEKFLFGYAEEGAEEIAAAAAGTTYRHVDDEKDEEGTYSVTVYFVVRSSSRDESLTRDVTYLLLPGSKFTAEKAEEIKAAFAAGEISKEALLALQEEHTDATSDSIENLGKAEFGFDEVDQWLFADERAAGDYELITTSYDKDTYYVLMYVDAMGDAVWYLEALEHVAEEKVSDWYEEATKTYPITIREKAIAGLNML